MIRYFREKLHLSIQVQLDNWGCDLDLWEEVVEKSVDAKAKANLQLLPGTRKIDTKYPKGHRPSAKKDKNIATRKHRDDNKDKAKSHSLFNAHSQPQT